MCARYIFRMGINRKRLEGGGVGGGTPTLSLCLAWISILCGINRCFKAKKKKVLTFFLDIPASLAAALRVEALCAGFFFSLSF